MKNYLLLLSAISLFYSCNESYGNKKNKPLANESSINKVLISPVKYETVLDRTDITNNLKAKTDIKTPLSVHVFVPLCDNKNQGIVPTSPKLGNGMDLRNNLYWGVRHGMKTIFKNNKKWKLLKSYKRVDSNVLERVIYERFYNNTKVILTMDAYRGDKMKECLEDYFNSLAENIKENLSIDTQQIAIYGNADLLVFNGHNGLMDTKIEYQVTHANIKKKDAIAIACSSKYYFLSEYKKTHSYPLVTTSNNLYPGGFILEGILDKWATFSKDELIRQEAGNAYHKVKKCGIRGARNLFRTGWGKL